MFKQIGQHFELDEIHWFKPFCKNKNWHSPRIEASSSQRPDHKPNGIQSRRTF